MPNPNLTLISIILDRSGSMASLREATVAGVNAFLDGQRQLPGDAVVHLVQFDHDYDVIRDFVNLKEVKALTQTDYEPRGWTALYDAMGRTITDVGARLAAMPEATRPGKVVVVIQTDGEENHSREYRRQRIQDMVKHQRQVYSWEFIFLGANIDAISAAEDLGILRNSTLQYSSDVKNTRNLFAVTSRSVGSYRGGDTVTASFNSSDRASVINADDPQAQQSQTLTDDEIQKLLVKP